MNHKKIYILIIATFLAIPSLLKAQAFIDGVIDSVVVTPVNLITFNGNKIEKNVQLNWTTVAEKNNSHFNIQRSSDGMDFESIAKVYAKTNSTSNSTYQYKDANVPDNNLYYRLQQVDIDGKSTLSAVILVKYDKRSNVELSINPNPVINHTALINLKNAPIAKYNIALKTINGKVLFTKNINQYSVDRTFELQLPANVTRGIYLLNLTSVDGIINLTQKIIIE